MCSAAATALSVKLRCCRARPAASGEVAGEHPQQPRAADGTSQQIEGKLHYSTVGFALEIRDGSKKEVIETLRPIIMDKFISLLGRKGFKELTTVQGRYLLRTQLLESVNQIVAKASEEAARDGLVTNIYFTQFIVQ